jgi:hypothetical protein
MSPGCQTQESARYRALAGSYSDSGIEFLCMRITVLDFFLENAGDANPCVRQRVSRDGHHVIRMSHPGGIIAAPLRILPMYLFPTLVLCFSVASATPTLPARLTSNCVPPSTNDIIAYPSLFSYLVCERFGQGGMSKFVDVDGS